MKHTDWATRLDTYLIQANQRSFSHDLAKGLDCCTFTWGAIYAQTGVYIGQHFCGMYKSATGARRLMKTYCGLPSLQPAIVMLMREQGFRSIDPLFAQRGDAVLVPDAGEPFHGIVDLNGRDVLGMGEHGLRRVPISVECLAWRIA